MARLVIGGGCWGSYVLGHFCNSLDEYSARVEEGRGELARDALDQGLFPYYRPLAGNQYAPNALFISDALDLAPPPQDHPYQHWRKHQPELTEPPEEARAINKTATSIWDMLDDQRNIQTLGVRYDRPMHEAAERIEDAVRRVMEPLDHVIRMNFALDIAYPDCSALNYLLEECPKLPLAVLAGWGRTEMPSNFQQAGRVLLNGLRTLLEDYHDALKGKNERLLVPLFAWPLIPYGNHVVQTTTSDVRRLNLDTTYDKAFVGSVVMDALSFVDDLNTLTLPFTPLSICRAKLGFASQLDVSALHPSISRKITDVCRDGRTRDPLCLSWSSSLRSRDQTTLQYEAQFLSAMSEGAASQSSPTDPHAYVIPSAIDFLSNVALKDAEIVTRYEQPEVRELLNGIMNIQDDCGWAPPGEDSTLVADF